MTDNAHEIRWMVNFWHSDGDRTTEPDFPEVSFWHPNKRTARMEAARVLAELRERGDARDWVAAGYPDPLAVSVSRHFGGRWILSLADLEIREAGEIRIKGLAETEPREGGWEEVLRLKHEQRLAHELDWVEDLEGLTFTPNR